MTQTGKDRNDKAGEASAADDLVLRRHGSRPRRNRPAQSGWTMKKRAAFLAVLKESCNVREAARSVGMSDSGAYDLRRRDHAFAAEWAQALEQGYAELEMLLLRQAIYGSETTETVDDGNADGAARVKTVHSYPHAIALRLLLAHKGAVDSYRQDQGIERPGSDDVTDEIRRRLDKVRRYAKNKAARAGAADSGGDDPGAVDGMRGYGGGLVGLREGGGAGNDAEGDG